MAPIISDFNVTRVDDDTVRVSFFSTEVLDTISVLFDGDTSPPPEMDQTDFTRTGGNYTGTIDLSDGEWSATLDEASNGNGDGADSQSVDFTVPIAATSPRLVVNSHQNAAPVPVIVGQNVFTDSRVVDNMTTEYINIPNLEGPVYLSFGNVLPNREIRYTTGGKNPTSNSLLYEGPIEITRNLSGSDNTVIKARYYDPNNSSTKSKIVKVQFRVY